MSKERKPATVDFPYPTEVGPRPWGREILLVHAPGRYTVKRLEMNAGFKGGLQAHRVKDETGYVISGQLLIRWDPGIGQLVEKILNPGDYVHIPPGAVHQEEALTDCVIIETSTPVFNDRVRMEEKYGQKIEGGLPTTEFPDFK
jgi:quercetin dioxygenase-like cupin family protein